jgi:hypothetical protein
MWFEERILKRGESMVYPYREKAKALSKEYSLEYQQYVPRIEEVYGMATYWHGTGRFHYQYQNGSRYENVDVGGLVDVLDSILMQGGLMPHHDPWIDSGGKTVSLGTVRMYSRLFARIHLYEHDTLLYEF